MREVIKDCPKLKGAGVLNVRFEDGFYAEIPTKENLREYKYSDKDPKCINCKKCL